MSIVWTKPPLRFDPSFERVAPDEDETIAAIVETMRRISAKTLQDSGHANRSVHAKAHALLRGELSVLSDLPEPLAQGLFALPRHYPAVLRFSTNPGDILDDAISLPRGLAVKVVGVEGARLPGSADSAAQDFVMIDAPAFSAPDAKGFLRTLKLLAATTDRAEGAKIALSSVLRGAERIVEAFGGKSAALVSLGGHPQTNPAGATYYTQVPLRHGSYVAKLAVAPRFARTHRADGCAGRPRRQAEWTARKPGRVFRRKWRNVGGAGATHDRRGKHADRRRIGGLAGR